MVLSFTDVASITDIVCPITADPDGLGQTLTKFHRVRAE